MSNRPQLLISPWVRGDLITYRCSVCGQIFLLPGDRSAKEAMAEVLAAFQEHVGEVYAGEIRN
jgi:hypothetical protein